MLPPEHQVTISSKHLSYLKILNANFHDGETVSWAVIEKAYKNRVLIVHPYKGGSKKAFDELNTAFHTLKNLIEGEIELGFDEPQEVPLSTEEMYKDLKDCIVKIDEDLDNNFRMLQNRIKNITANLITKHSYSTDEPHGELPEINAILNRLDVTLTTCFPDLFQRIESNIDIPFYMGFYTVFLGFIVSAISCEQKPQNLHSIGTFVFGAGLIAIGGDLIANSLFKKNKPILASQHIKHNQETISTNSIT